jgi:lipopolysaccharide biosynthesis glycosyltransferase
MNVLYSSSRAYFNCFLVSAYTLCRASIDDPEPLNLILLSNGLTDEDKNKAKSIFSTFKNVKLSVKEVFNDIRDNGEKMNLPSVRGSYATYFRLFAADLLPSYDKVICLDSDTYVRNSIYPLWKYDLSNRVIGAVPEASVFLKNSSFEEDFVLAKSSPYYNIGICVIDLNQWRSLGLSTLISKYFATPDHHAFPHDQSVMNFLFNDKMTKIPLTYNFSTPLHYLSYKKYLNYFGGSFVFSKSEFEGASSNPSIVHYFGQPFDRPWYKCSCSIFQKEYRTIWASVISGPLEHNPHSKSGRLFQIYDHLVYFSKKYLSKSFYIWFRFRLGQTIKKTTGFSRISK